MKRSTREDEGKKEVEETKNVKGVMVKHNE
jgi:hypothetical protein